MEKSNETHKNTRGLLDRLIECNTYDAPQFMDFLIENTVVGKIHRSRLDLLKEEPTVFEVGTEQIALHRRLDTPENRTEAVGEVLEKWRKAAIIQGWRDEAYRVSCSFDAPPLMLMERSAVAFFGIMAYGVHLNGITEKEGQIWMWIARRSAQKSKFPGYLDHLVAGGLPAAMNAWDTLIKECAEEAGISQGLATQARPVGAVYYCKEENWGLEREILFVYDLNVTENFTPRNMDGEVEEFFLWPIEKVMAMTANTKEIQPCCHPVLIDFLVRHGYLCPEDLHYPEIVRGLWGFESSSF